MPSTSEPLEELEAWARREVDRLRAEAARLTVALGTLERELSRLVVAREALRSPLPAEPVAGIRVTVPLREPGMDLTALPGVYRTLAVVLAESQVPLQALELTRLLGLEPTVAAVKGVRAKAKRLVLRGWAVQVDRGRYTAQSA